MEEKSGFDVVEDRAAQIDRFKRIESHYFLKSIGLDPNSHSDVEEQKEDVNIFN